MARMTKAEAISGLDFAGKRIKDLESLIDDIRRERDLLRLAYNGAGQFLVDVRVKSAGLAFENVQLQEQASDLAAIVQQNADAAVKLRADCEELKQELQHKSMQLAATEDFFDTKYTSWVKDRDAWRDSSWKWYGKWLELENKRKALISAAEGLEAKPAGRFACNLMRFVAS